MRKLFVMAVSVAAIAAPAVPVALGAATRHVKICDCLAFQPHKLKVRKGTRVVWRWGGALRHNVTVVSGPQKFHSPTMSSGTYSHVFKKKGTYKLICTIHGFKLTVTVH